MKIVDARTQRQGFLCSRVGGVEGCPAKVGGARDKSDRAWSTRHAQVN